MNISDIISFIAITLSIFTLYWTAMRPAKLICPIPRLVGLYINDTHLFIAPRLVLTNGGARTGHINYLYLELLTPSGDNHRFNCYSETPFHNFIDEAMKNSTKPYPREDFPRSFPVTPGALINKDLIFLNEQPWEPREIPSGRYKFTLYTVPISYRLCTSKHKALATCELNIPTKLENGEWREAGLFSNHSILELQQPLVGYHPDPES